MLFGPLEIFLCLVPVMLVIATIGMSLAAQNLVLARKEREIGQIKCPHCYRLVNPEAYICRFCSRELVENTR